MNINMLLRKNSLRTSEYEMKLRKETLILCEILIIAAFIYTYIVYGISRPDKGDVYMIIFYIVNIMVLK